MTHPSPDRATLHTLDAPTRSLVRLAAVIAAGDEQAVREAIDRLADDVPERWVEELLLQTYLFAGFPRALNATRAWRRRHPEPVAPTAGAADLDDWRARGEATCATVYGPMYARLRRNIRDLHPLLDDWMIVEGYGKVLSRDGLDLARRELCIVAACAATGQERQLHSHLHGALNAGASPRAVGETIDALDGVASAPQRESARRLWARVRGD